MKRHRFNIFIGITLLGIIAYYFFPKSQQAIDKDFTYFLSKKKMPGPIKKLKDSGAENSGAIVQNINEIGRDIAQEKKRKIDFKPKIIKRNKLPHASSDREKDFDQKYESYTLKQDLYAIKKSDFDEGDTDMRVVDKKLGYVIVESPHYSPANGLAIVTVDGSEALAIFTGIVKLKIMDSELLATMLDNCACELSQSYEYINSYSLQFDSFAKTMEFYRDLKEVPGVERKEIELLQYERETK